MHSVHTRPCRIYEQSGPNNKALPMATHPKILGLTLDPKLTYSTHIHNISVQAHKPLQIIKALTATGWGKQKETLMATYKAVMRPALEYASSVWSPIASSTSINKLQVMQNAALRTATGCTQDTNIQHLHDETLTLPIHDHLQLHASQYKQKTHPLHKHTTYFNTPRLKKTIFNNGRYTTNIPTDPHTVTTTDIKTNMRHIHTSIVSRHLATRGNNKILRTPPPHTSSSEEILPRLTRRTLAQLRTNKSPFLNNNMFRYRSIGTPMFRYRSIGTRMFRYISIGTRMFRYRSIGTPMFRYRSIGTQMFRY